MLAQDLVDNNFTVVMKYTGGPKTLAKDSIVVMVAGRTVEMFQTYMVSENFCVTVSVMLMK